MTEINNINQAQWSILHETMRRTWNVISGGIAMPPDFPQQVIDNMDDNIRILYFDLLSLYDVAVGVRGEKGDGITNTTFSYASSTSGTVAPTTGWQNTIPNVDAGSFLWTRTILFYSDNTTKTFYIATKQGEKGLKGDTGSTPVIEARINMLPTTDEPSVNKTGTNENPILTFNIPRGESGLSGGVTAPVNGWFVLNVDEVGDLWCVVNASGKNPFEYDNETGNLYFVINDN
jgi:hypothetical protein